LGSGSGLVIIDAPEPEVRALTFLPSVAFACALLLFATSTRTQDAQVESGRAIAEGKCAECHAVGPVGKSIKPDATPFRALMQIYRVEEMEEALEETLREAIKSAHPDPKLHLSQAEIDDLIAYLGSLAH
jgi:mono/diheme cytochrome c family protein